MTQLASRLTRTLRSDQGATAVEYALMVTFIAMVIIAAVVILGTNLSAIFADASTRI